MGIKGYLLIKDSAEVNEKIAWDRIKNLENIDGVTYSENLIGEYDYLIFLEVHKEGETLEAIAKKVKESFDFKEVKLLKINNHFLKHREIMEMEILNNIIPNKK